MVFIEDSMLTQKFSILKLFSAHRQPEDLFRGSLIFPQLAVDY